MGIFGAMTIVLFVLKLIGLLTCSWLTVFAPLLIGLAIVLILCWIRAWMK